MKNVNEGNGRPARPQPEGHTAGPALPPNYLRACLQLLLAEGMAHGYQLAERVAELGLDGADRGGVYRVLRSMEHDDLVQSSWEDGQGTPPKRTYELTADGFEQLGHGAACLREGLLHVSGFLARFEAARESRREVAA